MPWIIGTALLHSAIVVEKRDTLKAWTILLAILTFSLSLIGTFLVRSGVLTSVHAFASDPLRGVFILLLLGVATGGALLLFAIRAPSLQGGGLFAPISRELQRASGPDVVPVPLAERAAPVQAPIAKRPVLFGALNSSISGTAAQSAGTESKAADAVSATQRALARTGAIGLIVPDVASALERIQRLTQSEFGAVTGLEDNAPARAGGAHTAQVTLSVPDDRFGATLETLAGLGGVTSRSVTTEDLTDSIVDADARLRNLRHEETDLLRIMDRSGKIADVLDVEQQLASTREAIEQLDAQTKSMRRRVAYATITVDLSDEKTTPVAVAGPGTQIADAWRAALRTLWGFTIWLVAKSLLLVAFAPYVAVLALAAYLIRRRFLGRG